MLIVLDMCTRVSGVMSKTLLILPLSMVAVPLFPDVLS